MRNNHPPNHPETLDGDLLAGLRDQAVVEELPRTFDDSGIAVNAHLGKNALSSFETSPIVDSSVKGLGEITLRDVRYTGGKNSHPIRTHRLYTFELNGYRNAVEITDPVDGEADFNIFSTPGLTECIEGPIRKGMQASMSNEFPNARIISRSPNGIGITGDRYGWNERSLHGLNAMGSQTLALTKALSGDTPVLYAGTSMGTVITHRALHENIYGDPENGTVNVLGQFLLSAALVDPKNVFKDMGIKFIPGMVIDSAKELTLKSKPWEMMQILIQLARYGLSKDDVLAMGHQIFELLEGTKEDAVADVVSETPTVMVAGEHDCVAQWPMWQRLEAAFPENVHLKIVNGRGHGLGMKPQKACDQMARAGRNLPMPTPKQSVSKLAAAA